jgi:branched-chain amino acid transport system substrate-binding protein
MTDHKWTRRNALNAVAAAGAMAALPLRAQESAASTGAATGAEIRIGQSAHLTGPLGPTFLPVVKGQEMAIDEVNRKGGIQGRPVKLITLDDAYDPKKCVENVNTLIDKEKVIALFGLSSATNVMASLPILTEKKIPLIGVYTGLPALRSKQHPYFFTTMASYRDEVTKMMQNLATGQRRRLALAVLNNAFGKEMAIMVEEVAKEQGTTIVATQTIELSGQNAAAACKLLGDSKPDGFIMMAFGPSIVQLVKAARAYIGVPIYAPTIANSRSAIEALGDEARGLAFTRILPNSLRTTTPLTRDYANTMERAKIPLDHDHFFGYLNLRVLLEGLRRTGKGVTSQSLVSTMERMGNVDLGGYKLNFGPQTHHGSKFVDLTVIGPGGRYIM